MASTANKLGERLQSWQKAGLINADTVDSIERWEAAQVAEKSLSSGVRLGLPARLAVAFGSILFAAGILLFVSAHWDALAPQWRFSLLLGVLLGLHGLAAYTSDRFQSMAVALHGAGTVVLGGGIFLSAQIFHLEAYWSAGLLLWAIGAAVGWALLRQWPQLAMLAMLLPVWLFGEWARQMDALNISTDSEPGILIPVAGLFLLCLTYFTAPSARKASSSSIVLMWIGGLFFLPVAIGWGFAATVLDLDPVGLPTTITWIGWTIAIVGPLLLGWVLRHRNVWPLGIAVAWMFLDLVVRDHGITPLSYAWWEVGAIALTFWGYAEARTERINLGTALIAIILMGFYFSEVMGRFDRSLSLIGLGLLFLGGGWALERFRRQLVGRSQQRFES